MPGSLRILAACAFALLFAVPVARAEAEPALATGETPSPAVVALRTAASATAVDLHARAADLPGRAHLGGLRLGAAARTGLAQALPDSLLDPMRSTRDTASSWYANTGTVVRVASSLRARVTQAGGVVGATDRMLDLAAALAVASVALCWAFDARRRRRSG